MRILLIALILCAASTVSAASLDEELRACMKIKESTQRLACYDTLTIKRAFETKPEETSESTPSAPPGDKGAWNVHEDVSKLDDSKNVSMYLRSMEEVSDRFGRSHRPSLHILCRENKTDLYINFDDLFMSDLGGYGEITYRLDKLPPKEQRFGVSTDHMALGLWGGSRSIPFIKSLFGKSALLIRATPHTESAITLEFNIARVENAIKPLREACDW